MPLPSIVGNDADWLSRLKAVLPGRWFGPAGTTPVLDVALDGIADMFAWLWAMLVYVQLQARIGTATGNFLDGASRDYNGSNLPRFVNENDAAYRARIIGNMFAPNNTRAALVSALTNLTGYAPVVFEPANTGDTGAWDTGTLAWDAAGGWGDTDLPFQFFVTAQRRLGGGVPGVSGWDSSAGAWDAGALAWIDAGMQVGLLTDAAILAAINQTKAASYVAWTRIV